LASAIEDPDCRHCREHLCCGPRPERLEPPLWRRPPCEPSRSPRPPFAPIVEPTFPQVCDIANDPDEKRELWKEKGYAHPWVMKPVTAILGELARSMAKYPNIKPGQEFAGYE